MKKFLALSILVFLCLFPQASDSSDADETTEEYWCYGDSLCFAYEGNSANVQWTVTDKDGTVRATEDGDELEFDASHFDTLYVTQTVTTGQGSSVQVIKVNLMHHTGSAMTVSFYSGEGSAPVDVQSFDAYTVCKNGVFAQAPATPSAPSDSSIFGGWFTGSGDAEKEFSENDPVTESMDVHAKWLQTYHVTFISEGQYYNSSVAVEGRGLELPEVPVVEGKVFAGWYLDSKCKVPFDPESDVLGDQVLYAKWDSVGGGGSMFSPLLLIPVAAFGVVLAWMHMHRRKSKVRNTRRY